MRSVLLLEGINDIGFGDATAQGVIAGYRELIAEAHAAGVGVYLATLTPSAGSASSSARSEAGRPRSTTGSAPAASPTGSSTSGERSRHPPPPPLTPQPIPGPRRWTPASNSGDHVHPDDAGNEAMAAAVDLRMLLAG